MTRLLISGSTALALAALLGGAAQAQDALASARSVVAAATAASSRWDGPTTGPRAAAGKTVVYVAADLRNGGIQEVGDGVQEAGKKIGWTVRVLDGQGSVSGIQSAFSQAIALKPDGIVIGGFDVLQSAPIIKQAAAQGIKLVAWHGAPAAGPMPDDKIISNITSDSARVAKVAADYAIVQSGGHAGVIIFTDSALISAGRDAAGPPLNISAGDGSNSAYERIRTVQYQAATVPEPLLLQGWQVVDEMNRGFAGQPASGYVAPVHLVTAKNVDLDGGKHDIYDPDNGYRLAYAKIWGRN